MILTVAITLSISMLIARDAVNTKINSVRATTGNTISLSPAGFFGGQGGGTPLTTAQMSTVLAISDVTKVESSLSARLDSSSTSLTAPIPTGSLGNQFGGGGGFGGFGGGNGGSGSGGTFTPPIRVIGTNSPGDALVGGANNGSTETLTSGSTYAVNSTANVAIVGTTLATTNKLVVGSTFTAWSTKFTVVGIYDAGSTFANSEALMPLSTVQRLNSETGDLTSATVYVNNVGNVNAVQSKIKSALGTSVDVTSAAQQVTSELSPLNSVKSISTYTLIGTVVGAGLILLLSMLMIVRERRREIGVLKALGAPNRSVIAQFVAESTTFTVMGSVVGFIIGILVASPITNALVKSSSSSPTAGGGGFSRRGGGFPGFGGGGSGRLGGITANSLGHIPAVAGGSTLVFAFIIALAIAVIGSSVAAGTILRIRPAEVLRSE